MTLKKVKTLMIIKQMNPNPNLNPIIRNNRKLLEGCFLSEGGFGNWKAVEDPSGGAWTLCAVQTRVDALALYSGSSPRVKEQRAVRTFPTGQG